MNKNPFGKVGNLTLGKKKEEKVRGKEKKPNQTYTQEQTNHTQKPQKKTQTKKLHHGKNI